MRRIFLASFLLLSMAGCKVGPNYRPPCVPMPEEFSEQPCEASASDDDLCRWWHLFEDPFLDDLLSETLDHNFDYRIALEQIKQARATYWTQFAQILPEFDAAGSASRFRRSQAFADAGASNGGVNPAGALTPLSPIRNFFLASFDAIWEIDLFGRLRRAADAAHASWQATVEEARFVKISVISEVANTYMVIRALQEKMQIAIDLVDADQEILNLANMRLDAGLGNEQEAEAARAALEFDKAALKMVETNLKQTIYSMGILLGRPPETIIAQFQEARPIPQAQGKIPVGLPSDLLRRRPDIRMAEREIAAATEQIGVAVAALYPQISLTGSSSSFAANPLQGANVGFTSDTIEKMFTQKSRIWGIGALATVPIFDFGKRKAAVDVQVSLQHQAFLNYKKTVIGALQDVEQSLVAYFNEQERAANLDRAVAASRKSFDLVVDLYQAGLADYIQVLQAKETLLSAMSELVDSRQFLATDLIAVYKALGGDW